MSCSYIHVHPKLIGLQSDCVLRVVYYQEYMCKFSVFGNAQAIYCTKLYICLSYVLFKLLPKYMSRSNTPHPLTILSDLCIGMTIFNFFLLLARVSSPTHFPCTNVKFVTGSCQITKAAGLARRWHTYLEETDNLLPGNPGNYNHAYT